MFTKDTAQEAIDLLKQALKPRGVKIDASIPTDTQFPNILWVRGKDAKIVRDLSIGGDNLYTALCAAGIASERKDYLGINIGALQQIICGPENAEMKGSQPEQLGTPKLQVTGSRELNAPTGVNSYGPTEARYLASLRGADPKRGVKCLVPEEKYVTQKDAKAILKLLKKLGYNLNEKIEGLTPGRSIHLDDHEYEIPYGFGRKVTVHPFQPLTTVAMPNEPSVNLFDGLIAAGLILVRQDKPYRYYLNLEEVKDLASGLFPDMRKYVRDTLVDKDGYLRPEANREGGWCLDALDSKKNQRLR